MDVISYAEYLDIFVMESTGTHWPAAGSRVSGFNLVQEVKHTSDGTRTPRPNAAAGRP